MTAKTKKIAEFCKKCGSIMMPIKKGKTTYMKCRSCSYQVKEKARGLKISEEPSRKKGIVVLEKDDTILPITEKECPECNHMKAYWWMQQTKDGDEPPTQFFRCTKCKHVWREYK